MEKMQKGAIVLEVEDPKLLVISRQVNRVARLLGTEKKIMKMSLGLDQNFSDKEGLIHHEERIAIYANSPENVLMTSVYALLQDFFGKLAKGDTLVNYAQEERILMLDMGRKYFSKENIFQLIDFMNLAQFNYLQLHFSENEGFRIASDVAPEAVSKEYLTKAEVREIILYAQKAGIEIIPDLDSPGHLKQLLKAYPQWQLQVKNDQGELVRDPSALNITSEAAVRFILSLYQEYAQLFSGSRYFHIGGDEFVDFDKIDDYPKLTQYAKDHFGQKAEAIDTYVDFVNRIISQMNQWGFIPRVWNDGFFRLDRNEVVPLSNEVEITYWTKWHQMMAPVQTFIDKGYQVINFNDNYLYYVLGENAGYTYPTYERTRLEWTPEIFAQKQFVDECSGVAFSVWSDRPDAQSQETVVENVGLNLLALMQKLTGTVFLTKNQAQELLEKFKR